VRLRGCVLHPCCDVAWCAQRCRVVSCRAVLWVACCVVKGRGTSVHCCQERSAMRTTRRNNDGKGKGIRSAMCNAYVHAFRVSFVFLCLLARCLPLVRCSFLCPPRSCIGVGPRRLLRGVGQRAGHSRKAFQFQFQFLARRLMAVSAIWNKMVHTHANSAALATANDAPLPD
jgi:hypothetical protein